MSGKGSWKLTNKSQLTFERPKLRWAWNILIHLRGIVFEDEDFIHADKHFGPLEGCEYDDQQNIYKLVVGFVPGTSCRDRGR